MPARGQRARLGLAVAHDAGNDQVWVVERRAKGVAQAVAQLASLVNRSGRLGGDVAGDAARERELLEQFPHPRLVFGDVRIDLAVCPLKVDVAHDRGAAVARPRDVDHVQVVLCDHSIQVNVNEVLPGRGTPVAQQSRLDVFELQGLAQERVVVQVDLADRDIVGGTPVGIHLAEQIRGEGSRGGIIGRLCRPAARGPSLQNRLHRVGLPSVSMGFANGRNRASEKLDARVPTLPCLRCVTERGGGTPCLLPRRFYSEQLRRSAAYSAPMCSPGSATERFIRSTRNTSPRLRTANSQKTSK